ncbi:MAG: hypothetical protein KatS3mg105_1925 [Gemmatales bacterium]|nr:MAG: hypothetical protein KatS3mg105_1925 [Gemmatales bacterium]
MQTVAEVADVMSSATANILYDAAKPAPCVLQRFTGRRFAGRGRRHITDDEPAKRVQHFLLRPCFADFIAELVVRHEPNDVHQRIQMLGRLAGGAEQNKQVLRRYAVGSAEIERLRQADEDDRRFRKKVQVNVRHADGVSDRGGRLGLSIEQRFFHFVAVFSRQFAFGDNVVQNLVKRRSEIMGLQVQQKRSFGECFLYSLHLALIPKSVVLFVENQCGRMNR